MSLPKWMRDRRITDDNELILYNVQLCKALSIAWEALKEACGLYPRNPCDCEFAEAMRRIEELGE